MATSENDYRIGYGRPPQDACFPKGRSGNPRGRPRKELAALLLAALNEKMAAPAADGRRREITKREVIVAQLVDKSAGADLRATKMLIDLLRDIERRTSPPPREAFRCTAADEEVVANLAARIRRAELAKLAGSAAGVPAAAENTCGGWVPRQEVSKLCDDC